MMKIKTATASRAKTAEWTCGGVSFALILVTKKTAVGTFAVWDVIHSEGDESVLDAYPAIRAIDHRQPFHKFAGRVRAAVNKALRKEEK